MEKHYPKIYIIGLALAMLVATILISRIPVEGAALNTNDLEAQVAELQERVANLEEDLIYLQWRDENKVVHIVRDRIWERAISCRDGFCYQNDPVLYAFSQDHSGDFSYVYTLLNYGYWSAEVVDEAVWLVHVTSSDGQESYTFVADQIHNLICWEGSGNCTS